MKQPNKMISSSLAIILMTGIVAGGCTKEEVKKEPIHLTISGLVNLLPETFKQEIEDPIKAKYPYLTIEQTSHNLTTTDGELTYTADIILTDQMYIEAPPYFKLIHLGRPLDDLIRSLNFDLSQFDSSLLGSIRRYGDKGQLYALPYNRNTIALRYNKAIFDDLHINYPSEKSTWDDILNLAQSIMQRRENMLTLGIKIGGLNGVRDLIDLYQLRFTDAETGKASVTNRDWIELSKIWMEYSRMLAGANLTPKDLYTLNNIHYQLAMSVVTSPVQLTENDDVLIPLPLLGDHTGIDSVDRLLLVGAKSEHPEEAFNVITYLVSKDKQMANSKNGIATSLTDQDIIRSFGANTSLGLKNFSAFFNANNRVDHQVLTREELYIRQNRNAATIINSTFDEMKYGSGTEEEIVERLKELEGRLRSILTGL